MIEWLGISHLLELSGMEAIAGFFTPLAIFAVFFVAQMVLPAIRVPGYVINPDTGEPRNYRLNGILVYVIALVVWWFELTGMPREWFYESSLYAVAGGTVFTLIFSIIAVFSHPEKEGRNWFLALWHGRVREISFFNERIDIKMWFYVVGGTMLSLNALSGAWYNYEQFGEEFNPGVVLYALFLTWYVVDYFVFERVQLYTYDVIHENLGFKMFWGGLMVFGWVFILPLWGMAAHQSPGLSPFWSNVLLIGTPLLYLAGWVISRGANHQKYIFKRFPDRKFLGIFEPNYIQAGERKILCSGWWGQARHLNYLGEGFYSLAMALAFGYFANPWAWIYFIYVLVLFTWRQRDDDRLCAEKYGPEKWAEYQERVKYRIIPGIY